MEVSMAVIRPFECVRPAEKVADRVAALPYDVYDSKEARAEVEREPLSFLKIDRAETQFDESVDMYSEQVYKKAHDMLMEAIDDGTFITDKDKAYYVYELTMDGRTQTGIVACASIDDYLNNVIKKHENTRADKELDRINHVDTCSAQTGPIFLAYRANAVISAEVAKAKQEKPVYSFTAVDGIRHQVWKISSKESVETIENAFAGINPKYKTPSFATIITGVAVGLPILFTDKTFILDFTSIGTIFAFVLVNGGILLMPQKEKLKGRFHLPYINAKYIFPVLFIGGLVGFYFWQPEFFHNLWNITDEHEGEFRLSIIIFLIINLVLVVLSYLKNLSLIPLLGLTSCLYLLTGMTHNNWFWFGLWFIIGLGIYFFYGKKNSKLNPENM
jgi:hypothetical protein